MLNIFRKIFYKLRVIMPAYHFLWAFFGALIYGFPSRKIFTIGVTGTKGKTTTLELLNAILEQAGKKTALLSSLRIKIGDESSKNMTGNTMPGRFFIQKFLRQAVTARCEYALIEVTSQGVAASRHKFIDWRAGIITNIAPEHIESHGSLENYRKTKLKFLRAVVAKDSFVFINGDNEKSKYFAERLKKTGKIIVYSKNNLITNNITTASEHLIGDFELENLAAAAAFAGQIDISAETINEAVKKFRGVPGRMEFVLREPFAVVVDYAHTPDSLRAVYKTLRERLAIGDMRHAQSASGRLVCVLGAAGGGRDKWKRPEMGKIAAEYCDEIILTNEDPYNEQPEDIIKEILKGCSQIANRKSQVVEIPDRKEALRKAISLASPGDAVVTTGKGSEPYMHFENGRKIPWDERGAIAEILKNKVKK